MLDAAVEELQLAGAALDHHPPALHLGGDGEPAPRGQRERAHAPVPVPRHRAVGLAREDPRALAQVPAAAEELAGEELQVEAHPPRPLRGQRPVEVDHDAHRVALRAYPDAVGEREVGVDDGVEPGAVALRVREGEPGGDLARSAVHLAADLARHGLPLARGVVQPQVAVAGHAHALLHDAHPRLVALRVDVLEGHHVHPAALEVLALVEAEGLLRGESRREREEQGGAERARGAVHGASGQWKSGPPARAAGARRRRTTFISARESW